MKEVSNDAIYTDYILRSAFYNDKETCVRHTASYLGVPVDRAKAAIICIEAGKEHAEGECRD